MAKYISLTEGEKEEIRRLTQLANRRILATEKAYSKEGKHILPREVVGEYQIKEKWQTEKVPISRSVKFESRKDYVRQINMLRSFERSRMGIREYTGVQREKTIEAIKTSLGVDELPDKLLKKINKKTAPSLGDFWNKFSDASAKLGLNYSSDSAMTTALSEYFNEDIEKLLNM